MAGGLNYPLYARDGYWDCLWEACVETGTPISFHIGGGRIPIPTTPDMDTGFIVDGRPPSQNENGYQAVRGSLGMFSMVQVLMGVIFSGACEKYPDLQFVMGRVRAPAGCPSPSTGWTTSSTTASTRRSSTRPSPSKPSEYWYRQGFTTFQEEYGVSNIAHLVVVR